MDGLSLAKLLDLGTLLALPSILNSLSYLARKTRKIVGPKCQR
jgi:hypothetical protein